MLCILHHFLHDLEKIKESERPRIVNVSSGAHRNAKLTLENYDMDERSYSPNMAYANSKLANILFTKELAQRLENTGIFCTISYYQLKFIVFNFRYHS